MKDVRVRLAVATALLFAIAPSLLADDADEVARFVAALDDGDASVRDEASKTLVYFGKRAEPALQAAIQSADAEVHARAQAVLDEIALDRESGPSAWVRLPEGEPSIDALLCDVARQASRPFDANGVSLAEKTYSGPRGWMSVWEALDFLTRAADCCYEFPFDKQIRLLPGPAPRTPLVHAGPIRIEVVRTRASKEWGPSELVLHVTHEPNARPLCCYDTSALHVDDDAGKTLRHPDYPEWALHERGTAGGADDDLSPAVTLRIPLSHSREELPARLSLRGRIPVLFVREVAELQVDAADQSDHSLRGFEFRIESRRITEKRVCLNMLTSEMGPVIDGQEVLGANEVGTSIVFALRAADGAETPLRGGFGICDAGMVFGSWSATPPGPTPYRLVARVVSKVVTRWIEVDLRDLDLR